MISTPLVLAAALIGTAVADPFPKRGLAANDDVPITGFGGPNTGHKSQVNWQYNWDSTTSQKQVWAEYVPLLWGTQDYHTKQWSANAQHWLSNGSGHLLGFNEPDRPDQAHLSVDDAVTAWKKYMEPFAGKAALGAPAVSNGGLSWIKSFLAKCNGCHIDFVPVHWYNDASNIDDFKNWVNTMCSVAGSRPIWLTEFQGLGSADAQKAFLKQAIPFLDNKSCVYRYAYFGTADNSKVLLDNGGPKLSPLGVQYAFSPYGSGNGP